MKKINITQEIIYYFQRKDYISAINKTNHLLKNQQNNIFALNIKASSLKSLGRIDEAFSVFNILLKIDGKNSEIIYNLGNLYRDVGNLKIAQLRYEEAIYYDSNFVRAYAALSSIYIDNGDIALAKKLCQKGIAIDSNVFDLYYALSIAYFIEENYSESVKALQQAIKISNGNSKEAEIAFNIVKRKHEIQFNNFTDKSINIVNFKDTYTKNYFAKNSQLAKKHLKTILNSQNTSLKNMPDARFGDGLCSPDFLFLESNNAIIKEIKNQISIIMIECVNSEILLLDSFCNIFFGNSGTKPHNHLKSFDKYFEMDFRKFSLVWYLDVGDQDSAEPGILKLLDPEINILPKIGDVIIIPSNRKHSSIYSGQSNRVMIGVNFYSLPSY